MERRFRGDFPQPTYDSDVRQSYRGGWTYLNPRFAGKVLRNGIVLDVNSLYPSVMYYNNLPFGEGIFFNGKYKEDKIYNLYVQMFTCNFELKPGFLPTIQIKGSLSFIPTKYLTSSEGKDVTLCLTSVDLELFLSHYNVYNIEYLSGWKFKSSNKLFREYIDYWMNVKINAEKEENMALRTIAKLYLNNLYGKLAKNPIVQSKIPYLDENEVVKYRLSEPEETEALYIPCASFITAWARYKTISSAQKLYDRFIYADTDSLHLIGLDIPEELEVDKYKLGAWKHESTWTSAKFLRAKSYMEIINGKRKVTCAGLPKDAIPDITLNNFKPGFITTKNLKQRVVKGGAVLLPSTFEIKI